MNLSSLLVVASGAGLLVATLYAIARLTADPLVVRSER